MAGTMAGVLNLIPSGAPPTVFELLTQQQLVGSFRPAFDYFVDGAVAPVVPPRLALPMLQFKDELWALLRGFVEYSYLRSSRACLLPPCCLSTLSRAPCAQARRWRRAGTACGASRSRQLARSTDTAASPAGLSCGASWERCVAAAHECRRGAGVRQVAVWGTGRRAVCCRQDGQVARARRAAATAAAAVAGRRHSSDRR